MHIYDMTSEAELNGRMYFKSIMKIQTCLPQHFLVSMRSFTHILLVFRVWVTTQIQLQPTGIASYVSLCHASHNFQQ